MKRDELEARVLRLAIEWAEGPQGPYTGNDQERINAAERRLRQAAQALGRLRAKSDA